MRKLSTYTDEAFSAVPDFNKQALAKARRAQQVQDMWEKIASPAIVRHTNAVFIRTEQETKIFDVYVDGSIYAAELNAQREKLRGRFISEFNEHIDVFNIHISRGKYKKIYPFKEEMSDASAAPSTEEEPARSEHQHELIKNASCDIENEGLRLAFERAMQADLSRGSE